MCTDVLESVGFLFLMDDHFCCGNCYSFCSSASAMHHWSMTVYSIIQLFLHELMPICSMFSKSKAYDSSLLFHVYCFLHHSFLFIASISSNLITIWSHLVLFTVVNPSCILQILDGVNCTWVSRSLTVYIYG